MSRSSLAARPVDMVDSVGSTNVVVLARYSALLDFDYDSWAKSRLISAQGASFLSDTTRRDTARHNSSTDTQVHSARQRHCTPKTQKGSHHVRECRSCTRMHRALCTSTRHDTASRGPDAMSAHVGRVCLALQRSPCTTGGGRESVTASRGGDR
jgi:hypothetical protein